MGNIEDAQVAHLATISAFRLYRIDHSS